MKKIGLLFLLIGLTNSVLCQKILPDSIAVTFYGGGDYRDGKIDGTYDNKDSSLFSYDEKRTSYTSKTVTHLRKIIPWLEENINSDSSMLAYISIEVDKNRIQELMGLKDTSIYHSYYMGDSSFVKSDITKPLSLTDMFYFENDFSISEYGIDATYFECFCSYWEKKQIEKDVNYKQQGQCDDFERFNNWLIKQIQENSKDLVISSYSKYVQVEFYYKKERLIFYQKYPGKLKTTWWIYTQNNEAFSAVQKINNPRINHLIAELFPRNSIGKRILLEHQDKEAILKNYLEYY